MRTVSKMGKVTAGIFENLAVGGPNEGGGNEGIHRRDILVVVNDGLRLLYWPLTRNNLPQGTRRPVKIWRLWTKRFPN